MKKLIIALISLLALETPFQAKTLLSDPVPESAAAKDNKPDVIQLPALVKKDGRRYNLLQFQYADKDAQGVAEVTLSNGIKEKFELKKGKNFFILRIPDTPLQETITAKINLNGSISEKKIAIKSFRQWNVYLVHHTHTDIGYPEPQHEIMPEYLRYIDYVLDFCDKTDNYPEGSKFKWTCEGTWAVKEFMNTRPKEQVKRFLKRIAEGRIEVAGLYLNMSDMYDEPTLSYLMRTVRELKDQKINIRSAIQDDVNGVPWGLIDYMASAGIKYMNMGENPTHALRPFDIPTAFFWESPSGNRVLAYRAEQYHWANGFGILNPDMSVFENSLLPYLKGLDEKAYPFSNTMLQFSGYFIDDAPPSTVVCDLVKKWNEEFEYPKLKISTLSEFFKSIEKEDPSKIPACRLAWPDWWTDGVGSCALETFYVRNTQADFIANQGLLSMAGLMGAEIKPDVIGNMNSINNNIAFFDEHTFGAGESVSKPLALNSVVQWNEKSAFAWSAVKDNGLLREKSFGLLRGFLPKLNTTSLAVFNTMNTPGEGVTQFFAYSDLIPPDKEVKIVDEKGQEMPLQAYKTGPGGNYWKVSVKDVPAFGYKTYKVIVSDKPAQKPQQETFSGTLENEFYKIEFDTVKGGIISLIDKKSKKQLVDSKADWELGQFIYERLKKRDLLKVTPDIPYSPDLFTRTSLKDVKFSKVTESPIWRSITINGKTDGCTDSNGVSCEIRLYKNEKKIQFAYSMIKKQVYEPEAAYVAFPFNSDESQVFFEAQGGTVRPGKDQLPGSASDWSGVQNFTSVRSKEGQIVLVSPEAPLMEFGDINTGKFQEVSAVKKPHIYSYILNNYWRTNFRAAQEGALVWTYDITSSADTSNGYATKFGWGCRVPLVSTLKPSDGKDSLLTGLSVLNLANSDLHLVFSRPAMNGNGAILCLRELNGRGASFDVERLAASKQVKGLYEVNSLEEPLKKLSGKVRFRPFQVKFFMVKYR